MAQAPGFWVIYMKGKKKKENKENIEKHGGVGSTSRT